MEPSNTRRRLAAVLAADVAGYTRLMETDEDATMAAWWSHRQDVIDPGIAAHRGRIVKHTGDGFLAEFASVADAVRCADRLQAEMGRRNAGLAAERRMDFRIGINLCDIMADEDDIYGDGVNIAARIEALAEPGGICVTGAVRDQTKGKVDIAFEDLGEHTVKNIAEPVRVWRVRPDAAGTGAVTAGTGPNWRRWAALAATLVVLAVAAAVWLRPWAPPAEIASEERMAFPLPDKPSIAVMPFDNLSGDAGEDYIADGITEDITTALSQVSNLFVIARTSAFVYKGRPVKVQRIAEDLGVRYVLEGSVQRSAGKVRRQGAPARCAGKVRINAQLIDALEGHHLWAERYDREFEDLFALQDEITREIVTALQVKLTEGEQARVWRKQTRNMDAWRYLSQGLEHFHRFTSGDNARARGLFESAVKADPNYALGYALLAWTHWMDAQSGWNEDPSPSLERAGDLAQRALALDVSLPDVHALLGGLHLIRREYDQAVAAADRAVALNPNHATNTALRAMILHNAGRPEEAIREYKTAMRLSPYYEDWFLMELGFTYLDARQPADALVAFEKFVDRKPAPERVAHTRLGRALAFAALGREAEARAEIAEALAADPEVSASSFGRHSLNKDRAASKKGLAVLRRLGLPE